MLAEGVRAKYRYVGIWRYFLFAVKDELAGDELLITYTNCWLEAWLIVAKIVTSLLAHEWGFKCLDGWIIRNNERSAL